MMTIPLETNEVKSKKDNIKYQKTCVSNLLPFFKNSSPTSKTLLILLLDTMDIDNKVNATLDALADEFEISLRTLNKAMAELRRSNIIRRVSNGSVMINPHIGYKGQSNTHLVNIYENLSEN